MRPTTLKRWDKFEDKKFLKKAKRYIQCLQIDENNIRIDQFFKFGLSEKLQKRNPEVFNNAPKASQVFEFLDKFVKQA